MTMKKVGNTVTSTKALPGVLECTFEYEVKDSKARLLWRGPPIPKEVWQQVLSFFSWTYKTMHSESQVRMFVNAKEGLWRAWAYPQEARTGMSAREIDEKESLETGTERFKVWGFEPSGDWIQFCTVHHHCNMGAFQSSTDEADERRQDGLHITVGDMDKPKHSIHARFYVDGTKWEDTLDMSWFWDVGDQVRELLPDTAYNLVARHQMCQPSDVEFPKQWADNVREVKPIVQTHVQKGIGFQHGSYQGNGSTELKALWERCQDAIVEIFQRLERSDVEVEEVEEVLSELADTSSMQFELWYICKRHKIDPDDLYKEFESTLMKHMTGTGMLDPVVKAYIDAGNKDDKDETDASPGKDYNSANDRPYNMT